MSLRTFLIFFENHSKTIVYFFSLLIVAFGQPAFSEVLGCLAASIGYALFFTVLIQSQNKKQRFWLAASWFTGIQLIQLSWFISHPYLYAYPLYFILSSLMGIQFGIISLLITPQMLTSFLFILAISSLWTIFEWSRLFLLSGFSWNPIGIALTSQTYSLQTVSLWGVYGCTFWVMLTNLLVLRAWVFRIRLISWALCICVALFPYIYGMIHLNIHETKFALAPQKNVVLVQTAFPVEEMMEFPDRKSMLAFVIEEWKQILLTLKKQQGKIIDLIILPEYVVPAGTYSYVFPLETVSKIFTDTFGVKVLHSMPKLSALFASQIQTHQGMVTFVNNAFWSQTLANYFNAGLVIGLEDAQDANGKREYFSSAQYFKPATDQFDISRYDKRVLVPFGEYIPFEFAKSLAATYGIRSSFTPGSEVGVFPMNDCKFGISICYEETFGNLIRENKLNGADFLINLTSDVWYPNSRLPLQHFYHSRLRSVENGIPLARSTNYGFTAATDSFGRLLGYVGDGQSNPELIFDSLLVQVPIYTYSTLYTKSGDFIPIGFSIFALIIFSLQSLLQTIFQKFQPKEIS